MCDNKVKKSTVTVAFSTTSGYESRAGSQNKPGTEALEWGLREIVRVMLINGDHTKVNAIVAEARSAASRQPAAATGQEPIYQVFLSSLSLFVDTTKEAYDSNPTDRRRIVYAAPIGDNRAGVDDDEATALLKRWYAGTCDGSITTSDERYTVVTETAAYLATPHPSQPAESNGIAQESLTSDDAIKDSCSKVSQPVDSKPFSPDWDSYRQGVKDGEAGKGCDRNAVIEECAKVCDLLSSVSDVGAYKGAYGHAADRIRALRQQEKS
jgi:hypothetical protein